MIIVWCRDSMITSARFKEGEWDTLVTGPPVRAWIPARLSLTVDFWIFCNLILVDWVEYNNSNKRFAVHHLAENAVPYLQYCLFFFACTSIKSHDPFWRTSSLPGTGSIVRMIEERRCVKSRRFILSRFMLLSPSHAPIANSTSTDSNNTDVLLRQSKHKNTKTCRELNYLYNYSS